MALSKGRREQLEQAKKNAKIKAKQKQNKALIQQYNATHKNAPKQTISAKGGSRNARQSTGTTRSTVSKTRMNGSRGSSFGGSKTGGANTTTDRRANVAHKADAERRQSTTLRQGSNYLTGGSTRKATPYAAAQQVYTPLRSNDRRARAGRAADANRTINGSLGNSFGGKLPTGKKATTKTGTGKTWNEKEERQKAIDTLNANSMAWHNTSDEAEKTRLHAANDRIRKKFGMTYNGDTGATYLPKASGGKTNVSKPVVETARNAAFGQNYQTQEQRQSRYDELNNEIDRMQKQYPYLIAMDMKNRNAGEKLAAVPWLISHPKLAAAGINGDDQYSKMSTTNKKQADAMYQLYKRLNDEADAISKQSAGKAWGSGVANAALNAAGAVENGARYATSAAENALSGALKLAGKQDAGQFWEDVAKNTVNTSFADSAMQKVNDWAQPVGSAKKAQELAGSGARMLPGMALGAATGTASKVSSLLDKAPLANASLAAIFGDSAASGAREALNDGANLDQALAYGAGSGLTEVGTEKMFGGIPGLNEGVAKLGSKSRILNKAFDVLGEGVEEATSTLINPYLKRATYDKNAKNATAQELWDSAKGGMALAGIMQGANAVSERLANRRYGTAPAETTTSIHDANADVRAAEQMDNRLHPNTSQALPTAQRLALPEGNTRTANTLYANENGGVANNLRAFNNADTPDVLYGNMRGDFTSAPDSGSVLFASQNGQVSQTLPTGYLPVGRSGLTKVAAQVNETQTIPRFAVDDAGNPNGGLSDAEMQWAKLLVANQEKTGVSIQRLTHEIVDSTFEEYNQALQSAEQYVRDYTPQGTSVVWNADGTSFRASNNEKWYSDYYKKNGKAPSRAEAAQVAAQLVKADIQRGGGQFVSAELAQDLQTALEIQAAANALGENVISAQVVDGNLVVQRGKPAHTANIQDTNARLDRNIISPVMQGATAAPINLRPMQRAGQAQSAPTLADVRQARNDIMPKLTRAGAEAAQTDVQTAPPEITQPMQENAQAAQQADINPKLTKAEVTPESSVGAAETGFDPYSKMVNDYGAIEPGENPARVVDVPQSTNGTDRVMEHARTVMEAGITSDEVIAALQDEVEKGNLSREVVHDEDAMRRAADRLANTADKAQAVNAWDDIAEGKSAASKDDVAYGQALLAYFNKIGDVQNATRIASDLIAQASRAGQTLQATRMLKKLTPEGRVMAAEKMKENAQKNANDRYGKKAPQIELNDELMHKLQNADSDHAQKALNDVMTDVANQLPNTWWDKFNALRYTSMLTSLPTHIRNILGNVMMRQLAVKPKNVVGTVLESAADKANRLRGGEGIERTKSLFTNKKDRIFARSEFDKMQEELSGSKYDMTSYDALQRAKDNPFSGGILGKLHLDKPLNWINAKNSAALEGEDTLAKRTTYIDSMAQYMKANGLTEADMYNELGGETDALLKAREYATSEALKATFQDANILAKWLQEGEKKLGKAGEIAVGGLVPFKKTPANIIKRGLEYSPLGLLKGTRELVDSVRTGNTTPAQVIDSMSAGLTGTGIMALGYFLGGMGLLRGGDDEDSKKQYFDEMQGEQSYSLNIGGYSYTIDWAAPAVLPLFVGVELQKYMSSKNSGYSIEDFTNALSKITEPVFDLTMMQGINDAIRSASYGKGAQVTALLSSAFTDYFTQGLAPTMLGQVNRSFVDRTRRTTYPDSENNIPDGMEKVMQRTMQKWPGLSKMLPQALDDFGRSQENNPWWENFFSPGYLEKKNSTDAEKALGELYNATGDNSVLPSKPQKTYKDENGKTVRLTSDQWLKLTNEGGKISLDAIDKLTKSEAYKQMSNDERIEAVADIYKYAKAIAANKVYKKELDGTTKIVSESGIEPGLYYAYKEMEDSLNNDMEGWEARDQVFSAIKADSSLSDQEKNGLYHSLLIKGTSDSQWEKYQKISGKVTAEEYVDAMIQKQAITKEGEDIEKGRASLEATEFSYYLDSKGYTGEKRQALEDTFKFYSMVKADPANYTFDMIRENGGTKEKAAIGEVESAGISAAQYAQIKSAASGVTYEKGKSGAKLAAVAKVVSQNTANYNEYAAVMHALGYKKIDGHYTSGGKLPEESGLNTGINVNRSSASQKTSSAGFVNPTTASNSVVTSGYGGRNAVKTSTGYSSTNHDGIDIGGTGGNLNGQAADSIGGGKVTEVGYDENGYGNYVVVDHGNGYTSLYGHLQKATVKQGDAVSAGQQVGVIGSTGSSTAPHLHLRVHKNGQSIDPRTVIPGYK